MATGARHNKANGILSGAVVVLGVLFSILFHLLMKTALERKVRLNDLQQESGSIGSSVAFSSAVWTFGFAFIVPGIIGFTSAFVKKKGFYILHMVFCILTLLIMGAFIIAISISFSFMLALIPSSEECRTVQHVCQCNYLRIGYVYSCEDYRSMCALFVCSLVFTGLAWILTLVTTVLSGILACKPEIRPGHVYYTQPGNAAIARYGPDATFINPLAFRPMDDEQTYRGHATSCIQNDDSTCGENGY